MSVWAYLRQLYRPRQGWLMFAYLCLSITWLSATALLALSGWFITASAMAGLGLISGLNIFTPSAAIRALAIMRTIGRYAERVIGHEAILRILADLRVRAFTALAKQPAKLNSNHRHADLVNRLTADVDTLDGVPLRVFGPLIAAVLTWITVIAIAFIWGGWTIALIDAAGGALTFVAALWGAKQGHQHGQLIVDARAKQRVTIADHFGGLADLTAYGHCQSSTRKLQEVDRAQTRRLMQQEQYGSISEHLVQGLTATMTVAVLVVAWPRLDAAVVTLLALMTLGMNEALGTLPGALWRIGESTQAARRLMQLESGRSVAPAQSVSGHQTDIQATSIQIVELVCQRQPESAASLTIDLQPGQPLVVYGRSGAGKTSLLATLAGELEPRAGQLLIGNQNILALNDSERYRFVGFLSQNDVLMDLTIGEFLSLGLKRVDDQALRHALATVELLQTLEQTPERFDYRLGVGGSRISGGQARRLQLAALLLRNPALVLLDEPFRGLQEDLVQTMVQRMGPWLSERCAIIVTHDPQSMPDHWPRLPWPLSNQS